MKLARRGFSLIELLAAVAIIAILSLLIVSGVNKAVEMSRATQCAGNLRQLANAFFIYAQEHNGSLPQVYRAGSSGHWYYNTDFVSGLGFTQDDVWRGRVWAYLCPSDTNGNRNISIDGNTRFLSYGANINMGAGEAGDTNSPLYRAVPTPRMTAPSKLLMLADADNFFFNVGGVNLIPRHREGINLVFADGHGEWRKFPIETNPGDDPWLWWPNGTPQ